MPTLDDTPVDLVYLGATTACVQVRSGWPADPQGTHPDVMRVTFQDGIQRTFQGDVPFDINQAGPGGLRAPLAPVNSTRYNLFLIPHETAPNTSFQVIGDVTAPWQGPLGYYTNWVYVGSIWYDAGAALIPWFQSGEWFEHYDPVAVEIVAALDVGAVQVDLTTNGGMPSWASFANLVIRMSKDAALGIIVATLWQDNGAGAPRALAETVAFLNDEAVAQSHQFDAVASLSGGDGMIWRQRTSTGVAVFTEWILSVRSYRDPYVR